MRWQSDRWTNTWGVNHNAASWTKDHVTTYDIWQQYVLTVMTEINTSNNSLYQKRQILYRYHILPHQPNQSVVPPTCKMNTQHCHQLCYTLSQQQPSSVKHTMINQNKKELWRFYQITCTPQSTSTLTMLFVGNVHVVAWLVTTSSIFIH